MVKKDILNKIGYDPSDLNYSYFDMKEASYDEVELDLVSLPFLQMKNVILDHLLMWPLPKTQFNRWRSKAIWKLFGKSFWIDRLVLFAEGKLG